MTVDKDKCEEHDTHLSIRARTIGVGSIHELPSSIDVGDVKYYYDKIVFSDAHYYTLDGTQLLKVSL